jgi:uncharacterized protein YbaR (Trm112 family)
LAVVEMQQWVAGKVVCPDCPEESVPLDLTIHKKENEEILEGELICPSCNRHYPIRQGIAVLLLDRMQSVLTDESGSNAPGMLSAYLWSHFSDLLDKPRATDAYRIWTSCFSTRHGGALDVGLRRG